MEKVFLCHKCGNTIDPSSILDLQYQRYVQEPKYESSYSEKLHINIPLCLNCNKNIGKVEKIAKIGKTVTLVAFICIMGCLILNIEDDISISIEGLLTFVVLIVIMIIVAAVICLLLALPFWGIWELHREELVSQYLKNDALGQLLAKNGFYTGSEWNKAKSHPIFSTDVSYLSLDELKKVIFDIFGLRIDIFKGAKAALKKKSQSNINNEKINSEGTFTLSVVDGKIISIGKCFQIQYSLLFGTPKVFYKPIFNYDGIEKINEIFTDVFNIDIVLNNKLVHSPSTNYNFYFKAKKKGIYKIPSAKVELKDGIILESNPLIIYICD